MRIFVTILFCLSVHICFAQLKPTGNPTQFNTGWQRWGWPQADSGTIGALRDTNFIPRFPATRVMRRAGSDTSEWFYTGQRWKRLLTEGEAASVNARRSVTKATLDSLQLVNDTTLNTATGRKFNYQLDTTGRRAYYEDKYVVGKTFTEIRKLRLPDTSYIFRVNVSGVIGDYKYDPSDVSTVDDTVITIVTTAGYRYKRYIPDNIYDPKWFGAKADNSNDDTRAVEDCIRAIKKYSNNKGGIIRLAGNYRFDAVNFRALYPQGVLTFQIDGNVTLLNNHSWLLTSYKNIVGKAAGEGTQFGYGTTASITGYFTDTSVAAVRIIQGHNFVSDIAIFSHNIGLFFDGTVDGWIPTANIDIERVGISIQNSDNTLVSGILNKDCFWLSFKDVSVTAGTGRDSSACIRLINTVDDGFAGHSYLINFEHLVTNGFPVRIIGGVDAGNSFDINFNDWVAEAPIECVLYLDSRKGNIRYINLFQVGGADGVAPLIVNRGDNTSSVRIEKCSVPNGFYIHGDQVKNLSVDYMSFDTQTTNFYPQETPDFLENGNKAGGNIGLNVQRGWKEGIHTQLGYPQTFPETDAGFIAAMSLAGAQVAAGYKNYDGGNRAFQIKNDLATFQSGNVIKSITLNTGDKIIIGFWIKTDTIPNCSINTVLSGSSYVKWRESNSTNYARTEPYQLSTPNFDWTYVTFFGTVDSANNESVTVSLAFGFPGKGRVYFSRPCFYLIKKSDSVGERQSIEYARELINAIPNVPVGSRMMPLLSNLYIGSDSSIFNIDNKKFYNNSLIPYATADSNALTTKKYVDAAILTAGGYWTGSGTNIYNNNAGNIAIGGTVPGVSTKLNVTGMGLFTGGAFNPGDGTAAGVSIGYNTSGDYGFIQSVQTSVAFKKLSLNPGGGAVGFGTINPSATYTATTTKNGAGIIYQGQFENNTSTGSAGFVLNNPTDGWTIGFRTTPSKGFFEIEAGGNVQNRWYGKTYLTASDGLLGFSSETNYATNALGAMDGAIGRNAVGLLEINNGTLNTYRDLKLRNLFLSTRDSSNAPVNLAWIDPNDGKLRVTAVPATATTIYTGDGTLSGDRIVTGGANGLTFTSTRTTTNSTVTINNTSSGRGINVSSGAGIGIRSVGTTGIGLQGVSTDNYGGWMQSTTAPALYVLSTDVHAADFTTNPASTNTVVPIISLYRLSQSAGANNIGGSIDIYLNNTAASGTTVLANQIISQLPTATSTSETSKLVFKGRSAGAAGTILTLDGDGSITTVGKRYLANIADGGGTLAIGNAEHYSFTGTTTTWTLPVVSGNTGQIYYMKNRGSGNITLNSNAGGNDIYTSSAVNTTTITPGSAIILVNDGTYWLVE